MKLTCHQCLHYYVTWDPQFPHGCRTMGFKSRQMPMREVRRTMHGKECLLFEVKKPRMPPRIPAAAKKIKDTLNDFSS